MLVFFYFLVYLPLFIVLANGGDLVGQAQIIHFELGRLRFAADVYSERVVKMAQA